MPLTEAERFARDALKAFDYVEEMAKDVAQKMKDVRAQIDQLGSMVQEYQAISDASDSKASRDEYWAKIMNLKAGIRALEDSLRDMGEKQDELADEGEAIVRYIESLEETEKRRLN